VDVGSTGTPQQQHTTASRGPVQWHRDGAEQVGPTTSTVYNGAAQEQTVGMLPGCQRRRCAQSLRSDGSVWSLCVHNGGMHLPVVCCLTSAVRTALALTTSSGSGQAQVRPD
jgi:hypothetical protein